MHYTYLQLAKMIDHAVLNPSIDVAGLEKNIAMARDYDVASVCIMPYYLKRCAELLAGSTVQAGTTIGFPHGGHTTATKVAESKQAIADGGTELDMVVNISQVLSGNWNYVRDDINAVVDVARASGLAKIKVIFENAYLEDEHKIRLCEICGEVGADWVKTSTGFAPTSATNEDLQLMRKHSPEHVQVKAAGGVRTLHRLLEVRALGVTRAGATATAVILDEACKHLNLPPINPGNESDTTHGGY